jgi:hypothetical protein
MTIGAWVGRLVSKSSRLAAVCVVLGLTGTLGPTAARAADNWWETSTTNVYTIYPYWSDYTSKYPNTTLASITSQLDAFRSEGFNALVFQPVNSGDGSIFGGLASLDQEDIAPSVGSLNDYRALISAAHSRGMKILLFTNLGYASVNAPFFQKACSDFRNGVDSPERHWFIFSTTNTAPKPNGWSWQSCGPNAYYLEFWDPNAPAYDWTSQAWRDRAKAVVRFWMDLGTDGMSFDAPKAYYGITDAYLRQDITDVMNSYNAPLGYAEGIGADPTLITSDHFEALEDYEFSAQWTRPTPLANAIANHNPSALEGILNAYRDRAVSAGGVLWSPLEWGRLNGAPVLTPAQRALEAATVASVGALMDWHDTQESAVFDFWNSWSAADRQKVFDIEKAGRDNPALGPGGKRLKLPTNNDNAYYAFKRASSDGTKAALVVLNYTAAQQNVTVDLSGSGIAPQTPTDLINGGNGTPITSNSYTVTLPAYGYTFLGLPQAQGSGGTLSGGAATSVSTVDLSSEGTDDWAHWGLNAAGDFNHRSGVSQKISNYTKLGTGTVTRFISNPVRYSWAGGTPTASASNTDAAIFNAGNGSGFRLTVPAGTTPKRLKLYVGGWQAYVRVHAYLSDGSSVPYADYFDAGSTSVEKTYTLNYKAGSANQLLIIEVTVDTTHDPNGNVTLQAATLATPSVGLTGASANTLASTTLSTEGSDDWAQWGLNAVGDFNHKSGVTQQISNYSKIGTGTVARFSNSLVGYSWTGGTPTTTATNTTTGLFVSGNGAGFRITVPADTTRRTVRLYVGAWQAKAKIVASLSDASSGAFTDFYDSSATSTNKVYAFSYQAASGGQTLTIDVTVDTAHDPNGNVTLQAASLARPASGGLLSGGSASSPPAVQLSNEGTDDWAHWGLNAAGDFDHKSGVTQQIARYAQIGSGTVARYTSNLVKYSWTGGTPTASSTETDAAVFLVGNGQGFRITVPADSTQRTLKLYVGGWQAACHVRAFLSDGSATEYTDSYDAAATSVNKVYTLTFKAASTGQSLIVEATVDSQHDPNGNVTLQAATAFR